MKKHRAHRGFTLIEVMFASSIFVVALAGIFSSYPTLMGVMEHHRHTTYGLSLGQSTIEELLLEQRASDSLTEGAHGPAWYDRQGQRCAPENHTYRVDWIVSVGVPVPATREVAVVVSWREGVMNKRLEMKTFRD